MQRQETPERLTVKAAARTLNVSTKTIHRYLAKGFLTKIKEGTRTLVSLQELTAYLGRVSQGQGPGLEGTQPRTQKGQSGDTVTLDRERYESLLMEIGELRKGSRLMGELKQLVEGRDQGSGPDRKELEELAARVQYLELRGLEREKQWVELLSRVKDLEADLSRMKMQKPWWQK
ncbi:MAG TPA: helix-turn-helix domain-containing protein [Syntrophobacteraceae bacterium]|nr:helix-turn-helix domain-containing protein [Syntrophobacteraceae bacterium]